jgi:hypothetical protein
MRAIKIDPFNRTISEIRLTRNPNYTFDELYEIIGCSVADFVLIDKEIVMISDKEPDKKTDSEAFAFWGCGMLIVGVAIILGYANNRFETLQENKISFEQMTAWLYSEVDAQPKN